ncbi:histidine phosphatase family protein [Pelagibacteraceae bacterium]|nr:histidine phosphatase family protein [Pelagibacteraceae bacterium]
MKKNVKKIFIFLRPILDNLFNFNSGTKKIIILLFFLLSHKTSYAEPEAIAALQEGEKLVFIRHAMAPGGGDPENFKLNDCSTQRNLDSAGISQAKKIGQFFKDNNIQIDKVLSSEWCRTKDTAQNAFGKYKTFNALNSFFSSKFSQNREKQMKDLKVFVDNWDSKKNIVFVTHYVVILEALNTTVDSGEIIVADKNYKVIGTIETN